MNTKTQTTDNGTNEERFVKVPKNKLRNLPFEMVFSQKTERLELKSELSFYSVGELALTLSALLSLCKYSALWFTENENTEGAIARQDYFYNLVRVLELTENLANTNFYTSELADTLLDCDLQQK